MTELWIWRSSPAFPSDANSCAALSRFSLLPHVSYVVHDVCLQTEECCELTGPSPSVCRLLEHSNFLLPKLCSPSTHISRVFWLTEAKGFAERTHQMSEKCWALQLHGSTACQDPAFSETSLLAPILCLNRFLPWSPAKTLCCVCCLLPTWRCTSGRSWKGPTSSATCGALEALPVTVVTELRVLHHQEAFSTYWAVDAHSWR